MDFPKFLTRRKKSLSENELLIKEVEKCTVLPYKYQCRDSEHQDEVFCYLKRHHYDVVKYSNNKNERYVFIWR